MNVSKRVKRLERNAGFGYCIKDLRRDDSHDAEPIRYLLYYISAAHTAQICLSLPGANVSVA